jgi:CubicO group peptidase (beta-lactamase class C family)
MRRLTYVLFLLCAGSAFSQGAPKAPVPKTTEDLRRMVEDILKRTHTPGAGIALVRKAGPEWIAGIGLADVAAGKPVTPDTLFRIGSVSKSFVSLSVLKLQQEGKLSLQDTLRSRAPDLKFTNPWEDTDPVRIVNLLEHTTGWDDIAFREYAYSPMPELTLKEGMDFNPKSRTSRWKPGTRYSYTNSGPPAAAYVVEKVTGQRFEDYVEENWFKPLGMKTASYFDTPEVEARLTKLYRADGVTPFPYWHIIMRPAGAINASAREMANFVQFFLNRGSFGGVQLLPPEAIDRMEEPTSTYAAREGLKYGYGLSNYSIVRARIFHGHKGGVGGGLTNVEYLPKEGFGYVVMINSGNFSALEQIGGAIRSYMNRTMPKPVLPPVAKGDPQLVKEYAGWYEPISPRAEFTRALIRISGLMKLSSNQAGLSIRPFIGFGKDYVPVTDRFFRQPAQGAPILALIADHSEGTLVELGGQTFRRIPAWLPWTEVLLAAAVSLLTLSSLVFALVWIPRRYLGHMESAECISVRAMPALAALWGVCWVLTFRDTAPDVINRLGNITPWSVGTFVYGLAFAVFSVLGLVLAVRFRKRNIYWLAWWHAFAASLIFTIAAIYLTYWGIIGWRSWA